MPEIDEDFLRLNVLKKNDPDKWTGIANLMWGQPDNMQVLVQDLMQSKPYFKDKPELAKEEVIARYESAFMDLDEDDDDYEVLNKKKQRAIRNMEADALDAKERILSEFKKIEVPKVENAIIQENCKAKSRTMKPFLINSQKRNCCRYL